MSTLWRFGSAAGRWLARIPFFLLFYLTLLLTWLVSIVIFRVLNRTTVIGCHYRGPQPRTLVVSNHQSLIDSFLLGSVLSFPWILWKPWLAPYHLADARNFMTHPVLRYVYAVLRVIPVGRNASGERRDHDAFIAAKRAIKSGGTLFVFIEGMRSTTDMLLPPKPQVGALAYDTDATVLPVYFTGMHGVHPYRKRPGDSPVTWWRRVFGVHTEWLLDIRVGQRLTVCIGDPLTPSQIKLLAGQDSHRRRVVEVTNVLQDRLRDLRGQTLKQGSSTAR